MSDHPQTISTRQTGTTAIDWDDAAALHLAGQSDGLLTEATAVRRGTFAELIRQMMTLPFEERSRYVIEKAGDREYGADEIAGLAGRSDFPRR